MSDLASNPEPRFTFPRRLRLTGPAQFKAVYDAGARVSAPPLLIYAKPNGLDHPRLGLSISRRAGGAAVRNAIKRRLREAFRLMQHELPRYDVVISAKKHEPLPMEAYLAMIRDALASLKTKWNRR